MSTTEVGEGTIRSPIPGSRRWRGVLVVFGGILVNLSLGTLYTFGNIGPYITSYMRSYGSAPDLKNTDCSWIFAVADIGLGVAVTVGGLIEFKLGPRLTSLLGGWCMSLGVVMTFFTIKHSFALTIVTYGLVFGVGTGIAYSIPLGCAMRWFPEKQGIVSGLVMAGFGGGAFVFNQVQTAFINPHNLAAQIIEGEDEAYFTQQSVLERVPYLFLVTGSCYAVMQLVGSILLCSPPDQRERSFVQIQDTGSVQSDEKKPLLSARQEEMDLDEDVHPRDMLKSRCFYILFFILLFNGQGIIFVSSLYKAYGETFIADDTFLALVGSFSALFNALGRISSGFLADKSSFKVALMVICASFTCLMLTFRLAEYGGKPFFFIYVCFLFASFSGNFALLPAATAKCFGKKYMSVNIGLVYSANVITSPVGVFLTEHLIASLHYSGIFFLIAGFSFASFFLTFFFNAKDKDGSDI